MVSFTYPITTFDTDISSLFAQESHHFNFATLSCHMEGSSLTEEGSLPQCNIVRLCDHVTYTSGI